MQEVKDTSIAAPEPAQPSDSAAAPSNADSARDGSSNNDRKRKRFENDGGKHGRGGKKRDMGRKEKFTKENYVDRRTRNAEEKAKREAQGKTGNGVLPDAFPEEEIAAEDRKPKRKVAVLVGYSGTGYKGMQISPTEKTIEGDLFTAFVKAGAISKANADDPKKSGLVRCARTDKGVHAAGNMISLKLIIEDPDIVKKINEHLSPQIRVWGIERTIGSFSCYQACDSRWYEYLIPSHAFLPPHPSSWLANTLKEVADEAGDTEGYESRQEEVKDFWEEVEEKDIKPILESLDDDIRELVAKALYETTDTNPDVEDGQSNPLAEETADIDPPVKLAQPAKDANVDMETTETAAIIVKDPALEKPAAAQEEIQPGDDANTSVDPLAESSTSLPSAPSADVDAEKVAAFISKHGMTLDQKKRLDSAIKTLRRAYDSAKRRYRTPEVRIKRIQSALSLYEGNARNFHNYTILKTYKDPSSKRTIKSFVVNPKPIIINGTEWLSMKVHGQSFMMHQIRKMVGMMTLLVRCGADVNRIKDSYGPDKFSIPKVPGLGLLLERPVFDSYNELQATKHGREKLDFGKFETEMEEFKQREIYQRIFSEEERDNTFHQFFNHVDNYKERHFLWVTSKGIEATKGPAVSKEEGSNESAKLAVESDDEAKAGGEEES